jgi:tetratricopeptide (TPR) repeat protein
MKILISFCTALVLLLAISCDDTKKANKSNDNIAELSKAIAKDPKNAKLYYQRCLAYEKAKKDTTAMEDILKAIELDTLNSQYALKGGDILYRNKDFNASAGFYQRATKLDPRNIDAQLKYANLLLIGKNYPLALNAVNNVIRADVYNYDAYITKGLIYKDMGDSMVALTAFQTAAQMNPDKQEAYLQMAFLTSASDINKAKQYYLNAFNTDTTNMEPLNGIGMLYQNKGMRKEAKQVFTEIILKSHNYEKAYYNMGCILMDEDSMEKASRQFGYAIKNKPEFTDAYYNRGLCYERMGKKEEAIADFATCLKLDDTYKAAKDGYKRLGVELPK